MAQATAVILQHRGVLKVMGGDRRAFLQGIVSNDVERVTPERAVWSAFLTPQGKFLHEFFLAEQGAGEDGTLLLDCEADRAAYELCALSQLRERLRAGAIWVSGSRQFQIGRASCRERVCLYV